MKYRDEKPRSSSPTGGVQRRPAVGKRAPLDAVLRAQSVQQRAAPAPESPGDVGRDDVHAAAEAGVATPTTALPYQDQL
jgi:hypothetical protein